MKHFKTMRGAFKRKLTKFGDLITFDFIDSKIVHDQGFEMEKEILVIRDRFTGFIQAYPSKNKYSDDVVRGIKQFVGRRKIRNANSDKARQFESTMQRMGIPFDHSLPGRPQTNSLAERNNQFILSTTATWTPLWVYWCC